MTTPGNTQVKVTDSYGLWAPVSSGSSGTALPLGLGKLKEHFIPLRGYRVIYIASVSGREWKPGALP